MPDFLVLGNHTGVLRSLVNPMIPQSFQAFDLRAFRQVRIEKIKLFKNLLTAYLFSQRHSHIIYIHNVHSKPLSCIACI